MSEHNESTENAEVYELGYLVLPSIAEEALGEVEAKLEKLVSEAGGTKIAGESPRKIDLSYKMTKTVGASRYVVNDAYIGWMKFEAAPSAVPALKETFGRLDEIVRSLLIKAPRESEFTFAKAQAALEASQEPAEEAPRTPTEAVVE